MHPKSTKNKNRDMRRRIRQKQDRMKPNVKKLVKKYNVIQARRKSTKQVRISVNEKGGIDGICHSEPKTTTRVVHLKKTMKMDKSKNNIDNNFDDNNNFQRRRPIPNSLVARLKNELEFMDKINACQGKMIRKLEARVGNLNNIVRTLRSSYGKSLFSHDNSHFEEVLKSKV